MATTSKSGPDRGRLKQVLDRPVTLVGMMGSGKTIIGKKLAQELDLPFIDSDARIVETAGISIAEIFDIAGEAKFRAMERDAIRTAVDEGPAILSTGGGAICARNQTASDGNVVCARPETDGQGGNIMHNAMAYVTARCVSRALNTVKVVDQADSPSVFMVMCALP